MPLFKKHIESGNERPFNNKILSSIFHKMGTCYRYIGNEERFRAIAYENVAKSLYNMKEDIADYATDVKTLDEIGGIGESIAMKIIEYLKTGKIIAFEKLKKKVPYELLDLMDITGFGPATLKTLHEKLQVDNKEDLVTLLEGNRLEKVKGFGSKKIENMKRALKLVKQPERMPLKEAEGMGEKLVGDIRKIPGIQQAVLAGSLRRKKDTIGDIDIVIAAEPGMRKKIAEKIISMKEIQKILAKGTTKISFLYGNKNIQVDIRLVHDFEFGAALLYFTGNKEHNIKLRTIARKKGCKINEYGIFSLADNRRLAGETEEEMYRFLGLKYIPPYKRLDKGEIEKASL